MGRVPGQVVGQSIFDVYRDVPDICENTRAALAGETRRYQVQVNDLTFEAYYEPLRDAYGEVVGVVGVAYDITRLVQLQSQNLQMQRLEAVGQLAGGLAHDFNNMLTVIMANAELGLRSQQPGEPLATNLQEIVKASTRAASITRQLLAFSRGHIIQARAVDLNGLIISLESMLRHLVRENIELVILPSADRSVSRVDPGHIEQVLINLVINARDAIAGDGKIIIATERKVITLEDHVTQAEAAPGEYVLITVTDNGTGMPEDVKKRAFDPFFTTKSRGDGSGLGLATCYGTVSQSGGHISIDSQIGEGTTVKVHLPATIEPSGQLDMFQKPGEDTGGTETVLLVEDEPLVRTVVGAMLREHGYTVLEASNGVEALGVVEGSRSGELDLLLTDVVMPVMGGRELARRLKAQYPDLGVLYTSGHTDGNLVDSDFTADGTDFVAKPLTPSVLAPKVREVLDKRLIGSGGAVVGHG